MAAVQFSEDFAQAERGVERALGAPPPVVEITSHDQRFMARNTRLDVLAQSMDLRAAFDRDETEMDADQMHAGRAVRHFDAPMQQAAAGGEGVRRDVDVLPFQERVFAQNGIAMVAVIVERVLAVGVMVP